jgi:hypothetical protein
MNAVAPGDAKPFERQFYDDALIFDERGRAMSKARLVKEITPVLVSWRRPIWHKLII